MIYIYIYIYIYIITALVVCKLLCEFVADQMQYNMESEYIYIYIYILHSDFGDMHTNLIGLFLAPHISSSCLYIYIYIYICMYIYMYKWWNGRFWWIGQDDKKGKSLKTRDRQGKNKVGKRYR